MACCAAFHGNIAEIPNISVDNFTNKDANVYFLSHTHSDHTYGLYDSRLARELEEKDAFIYMSEMSAAIVKYEIKCRSSQYRDLKGIVERIRILTLETESIPLPEDPKRRLKATELFVTTIPASHSFGSVMFLFQAYSKTVLYTGDFRISCNDVAKFTQLHDKEKPINIDTLYVDTTFIDTQYTSFPKRSASVDAAIADIDKWLNKDARNRVAIKTSAKFGYEYVFNELHSKLGCKVYVEDERWNELYRNLPHLVSGVTNDKSPIHLCWPKHRRDHTICVPFEADNLNYLHIHLSAQKWAHYVTDDSPVNKTTDNDIDVCFSTHCSRSELRYFVSYFSPKHVVGFPKPYDDRSPVKKYDDAFCVSPKKARLVDRKMDKRTLKEIFDF